MKAHQSFQKRLSKLEARVRARPPKPDNMTSFLCLVWGVSLDYYLGNPEIDESMVSSVGARRLAIHRAHVRALNFQSEADYVNASRETRHAHFGPALHQLLAKFGVTLNDDLDGGDLVEASKQMLAGLPEPYREDVQESVQRFNVEWPIEFAEFAPELASDPHGQ
jgi:hypothetical protein